MISMKRLAVAAAIVGATFAPGLAFAAGPLDGLTAPPADPSLEFVAPTPDQANYDARLQAFLDVTVPDMWNGQPVAFHSSYDPTLGVPTSVPKADPNNPNFIYQRFQNGVLFYNGTDGTTSVLGLQR